MTIEEAKRILHPDTSREAIAEINEQNGYDHEKGIEKVKEACLVACEALDKSKWIPCSERLPENENKYYLVCHHYGIFDILKYCEGWNCARLLSGGVQKRYEMHDIAAWMELPEPYTED